MLSQYGVQSKIAGTSPVNGSSYDIALSPLFFVRGGYMYPVGTNKFNNAGLEGYAWSSRADPNTNFAYYLRFYGSGVDPSAYTNRYGGRSLRCLISTP